jgi:transcriptional regulator with PAS, ATPase and Fis domain
MNPVVVSGLSTEAQRILTSHNWPANVRELQGDIARCSSAIRSPLRLAAFTPRSAR